MEFTRRRLLSATVGVGTAFVAGCMGGAAEDRSESSGTTAQSSFFVFGDVAASVAGDAAAADLLVPVGQHGHGWAPGPSVREAIHAADLFVHGMAGFQPWVDDVRSDLAADGADVETVDASAGVDLLPVTGSHADEDGHTGDDEHTEVDEHTEADDHDHQGADPHFWMDPTRVATAIDTVEQALAAVDADSGPAYAENAENHRAELAELDRQFAATVDDAATETLLVAGHNSFQYLGDRYGVHVEALTNVSPDDRPTARDIEHAQEVIAEHDLRYVCADPLESQGAADQLVAETDGEEVLPLTAMPGLTDEWADRDWGYVEVMTNVNLPTLERALGA